MSEGFERVVAGSLWMVVDYGAVALLGAAFWVLVARMVPAADIGRAATALALGTTLVAFVSLGAPAASKFVAEYNAIGRFPYSNAVYRLCMKLTFTVGLVTGMSLAAVSPWVSSWVYREAELTLLLVAVAFSLPFQGLLTVLNASYQGCQRMDLCALGDSGNSVVKLIAASSFISLGLGGLGVVLGASLGFTVAALLGLTVLAARALPRLVSGGGVDPPAGLLRQVVAFSVPNYVGGIAGVMTTQVTLLLLGVVSMAAVAYYNIAYLIYGVLSGVLGSVGVALLPTVSGGWAEGKTSEMAGLLVKSTRVALVLGGPLILVALIFPGEILALVAPEYASASAALQVLALSVVPTLVGRCALAFLNGVGRPLTVMKVSVLSATTSLALSLALIPFYGPTGAAWAFMASALSAALLGFASSRGTGGQGLGIGALLKPAFCLLSSALAALTVVSADLGLLCASMTAGIVYFVTVGALKAVSRSEVSSVLQAGLRLVKPRRPL